MRNALRVAMLACLAAIGSLSWAQTDYPSRPVRLIIPFPPGGATDVAARLLATALERRWKQSVVVENRPGGGQVVGTDALVKSAPDGYTLGLIASAIAIEHIVTPAAPFNALRDLTPIAPVAGLGLTITVSSALPVRTLTELAAYTKANPGKLNWGRTGANVVPELEFLRLHLGMDTVYVNYKGAPLITQALLAGDVHITNQPALDVVPLVKQGKARVLAYTERQRHPAMPDVPTVAESGIGLPDFEYRALFGLFGPAGLPPALVARLNSDAAQAVATAEVSEKFQGLGMRTYSFSAADLRREMEASLKRVEDMVARGVRLN